MELIDKSALVAEIEIKRDRIRKGIISIPLTGRDRAFATIEYEILGKIESFFDTLEVKEVDIASMADDYYDALMKESDWMDVDTMGHCRLAYYNGCKDVLNKIQKGD